jgi:DNA (cytosine-5)-methyltransferase 1
VIKFRRDGKPITWAADTHGKPGSQDVVAGRLQPYRTAAECIDFTLPAKSIFDRKKPLARNTCKRTAKGLWRFVLNNAQPFIVPLRGTSDSHGSTHAIDAPLSTITGGGTHHALVMPCLTEHANASSQRVFAADEPLRTQVAQVKGGHFSLIAAHVTKFRANSIGSAMDEPLHTVTAGGDMKRPAGAAHAMGLVSAHLTHLTHHGERPGNPVDEPMRTITGAHRGELAVVQAQFLEQANGGFYDGDGRDAREPLSTICATGANQRLVSAYLVKYYGQGGQWQACDEPMHTIPTKDRMGLVQLVQVRADILPPELLRRAKQVAGFLHEYLPEQFPEPADLVLVGDYVMVDITLRMLVPRELARAQGFDDTYILDRGLFETAPGSGEYEWRPISKTDQVRLIGNSVCPDMAEAEVANDLADLIQLYARAA